MNKLARLLTLAAVSSTAAVSSHAGTFANISLDGFVTDWVGIAASATNAGSGPIDQIFLANNDTHFFVRITFTTATNIAAGGFRMNIDSDGDSGTGFNTYGVSSIGSEVLYEGDTAYRQAAGVYATGTSTPFALLIPDYGSSTTSLEFGIARTALVDTNIPIFQSDTINLAFYFEPPGADSLMGPIGYTFATAAIPEPSTFAALAGLGVLGLAATRRRR